MGVKKNSPVKITKAHLPRGAMVEVRASVSGSNSFIEGNSEGQINANTYVASYSPKRKSIVQ